MKRQENRTETKPQAPGGIPRQRVRDCLPVYPLLLPRRARTRRVTHSSEGPLPPLTYTTTCAYSVSSPPSPSQFHFAVRLQTRPDLIPPSSSFHPLFLSLFCLSGQFPPPYAQDTRSKKEVEPVPAPSAEQLKRVLHGSSSHHLGQHRVAVSDRGLLPRERGKEGESSGNGQEIVPCDDWGPNCVASPLVSGSLRYRPCGPGGRPHSLPLGMYCATVSLCAIAAACLNYLLHFEKCSG